MTETLLSSLQLGTTRTIRFPRLVLHACALTPTISLSYRAISHLIVFLQDLNIIGSRILKYCTCLIKILRVLAHSNARALFSVNLTTEMWHPVSWNSTSRIDNAWGEFPRSGYSLTIPAAWKPRYTTCGLL